MGQEKINPMEAENYLVPAKVWLEFERTQKDKIPTGIGYHESLGWFVLQTSGQGPYFIYVEKSD